jgi:glycosyltransferase involved in cell wall biosynthesis
LRSQFGYSDNDWIVICVAAWNTHHKRIDYVINEVAQMRNENVKLLFCGHPEPETPILKKLAHEKLPGRVQWLTLGEKEVQEALHAADVFVMPSLHELLGNSMVEAVMAGIPVVSHEHGASKFLLREPERMTDLSQPGNLTRRLLELMQSPPQPAEIALLQERAREQFSQETIVPRFYDMVRKVSALPPSDPQAVGNYDLSAEN